jgi:hypothetical protein
VKAHCNTLVLKDLGGGGAGPVAAAGARTLTDMLRPQGAGSLLAAVEARCGEGGWGGVGARAPAAGCGRGA